MGSSRKKKILLLAGSTYVFIIGSILVFIGLILVMILLGYRDNESESSAGRAARLRPDLIIFDDPTPSPVADVVVASGQTAPPVTDTPVKTDAASSDTTTGNIQADTTAQPSTSPTLAPTPTTTTVVIPLSSATLTPTSTPTLTPTPTPTISPTTTPTLTNTPSPTPVPGSIRGRILVNGVPAGGVTIKLEDQAINTIAQTVSNGNGGYTFANLTATSQGYNLVFAQEWNTQYQLQQVISWGWLGPITVADGTVAQIPDFDISLLGFEPTTPAANASFSAVSSSNPIQFKWASYPGATKYWVDLARGQGQNIVWQSSIAQGTSLSFDGTLSGGSQIQPGEYWWGVGARRDLGAYKLTVYGYLPVLLIVP